MSSQDKTDRLLEDIRRLLILQLIQNGVQSKDIAAVLKVDPATISRLVPRKVSKKDEQ